MTSSVLHWDTETRSTEDLTKVGAYRYFETGLTQGQGVTELLLYAYSIDDGPVKTVHSIWDEPHPAEFIEALLDPDVTICAHNAGFERIFMSFLGQKYFDEKVWLAGRRLERYDCTAARAAGMCLPRSLDGAARALGLVIRKDHEGSILMKRMCAPRTRLEDGTYLWVDDPESVLRLGAYCAVDVEVERQLDQALPTLSPQERKVWLATERMNDRGAYCDPVLLARMSEFVVEAEADVNERLREATNGAVPKVTSVPKTKAWLAEQGFPEFEDEGLGKQIVAEALDDERVPPLVREVLTLRQDGGKSSAGKYKSMRGRINSDHHARGNILYCGASDTSRFSSRGLQLQNLPRGGKIKDIKSAIDDILDGADIHYIRSKYGSPMLVASEIVRPTLIADPGHHLARGDYSQIEARVNNWFGCQTSVLDNFRAFDTVIGHDDRGKPIRGGHDLYRLTAANVLSVLAGAKSAEEVDDEQRQVYGKVAELSCSYGGGRGAFLAFARIYGVKISEEQAEQIKVAYREANPGIVQFWWDLENAAIRCMQGPPGQFHPVRRGLGFVRSNIALAMRKPSGRSVLFWYPKLEDVLTPWGATKLGVTYWSEKQGRWFKQRALHGGVLCAYACQSTARDIAAEALVRLEDAGMNPVLTVHDEHVNQVPMDKYPLASQAAEAVRSLMVEELDWYKDLPIAVDASAGLRYVKA